jgi:hypothetical protein
MLDFAELRKATAENATDDLILITTDDCYRTSFASMSRNSSLYQPTYIAAKLVSSSQASGSWICIPQIGGDEVNSPLFFVSYAQSRRGQREARRFFDDLSQFVDEMVAWPHTIASGFMDAKMAGGTRWTPELLRALGTCQILVALLSVPYTNSEWCGMEWNAFSQRKVVNARHASSHQTCIVPILWAPLQDSMIPSPIQAVQRLPQGDLSQADFQRYQARGLYGLLATGQKATYQRVVWQTALQIRELHSSYLIEPSKLDPTELHNAFR